MIVANIKDVSIKVKHIETLPAMNGALPEVIMRGWDLFIGPHTFHATHITFVDDTLKAFKTVGGIVYRIRCNRKKGLVYVRLLGVDDEE